jgi:ribulose-5-phosphate 4-epimerase/fuculose-1-phosphate aldolase
MRILRRRLVATLGAGAAFALARGHTAVQAQPASNNTRASNGPPSEDPGTSRNELIDDLVTANHILFREGIVDAFGHVTVRDPTNPAHYLMARSLQPPFVGKADILELDADSKPLAEAAPAVPLERFIHGEIYRLRPDVRAIVHSHAAAVLPFSVAKDTPLRAITHTAGFIGSGAPVFEIRDFAGDDSNLLVQSSHLGAALAKTLGAKALVLMRGHGFTVVGGSIREAVYNAVNTVQNARVEMDALRLGSVTYLTDAEAAATSKIHNTSLNRSWEVWAKRAAGELP